MIDSIPSLVTAISAFKSPSSAGERATCDSAFLQLLEALAGSAVDANNASDSALQVMASVAAQGAEPGVGLLKEFLSASDQNAEAGSIGLVHDGKSEPGNSSTTAVEMILALLAAAASQLQPWQLKTPDSKDAGANGPGQEAGGRGAEANKLAAEIASLSPSERWLFLEQAIAGQGVQSGKWLLIEGHSGLEKQSGGTQGEDSSPDSVVTAMSGETSKSAADSHGIHDSSRLKSVFFAQQGMSASDSGIEMSGTAGKPAIDRSGSSEVRGRNGEIGVLDLLGGRIVLAPDKSGEKEFDKHDQSPSNGRSMETIGLFNNAGDTKLATDAIGKGGETGGQVRGALNYSVIDQIARRAQLVVGRGRTGLIIQLEPKELGKVRVYVSTSSEGLHVRLTAEVSDTQEMIQASLPQLKTAFESQGLRADRFDVAASSGFSGFGSLQDNAQQHQGLHSSQSPTRFSWDDEPELETSGSPEVRAQNSLVDYRI